MNLINLFSGTVYFDLAEELSEIVTQIYSKTAYTNPLHPECFPGINKMEAEIVRMVCNLFNGNENCCGSVTSGGTESIVLAVKAYRDYAKHIKGIAKPELILPVTAHAAFQKACQYFCVKFKPIPINPITYKVNIKAMQKAITKNTILLVGSACGYPQGIIDDIESIAQVHYLKLFQDTFKVTLFSLVFSITFQFTWILVLVVFYCLLSKKQDFLLILLIFLLLVLLASLRTLINTVMPQKDLL